MSARNNATPPRLLLDEHVLLALAPALRERELDAVHVLEEGLGGAPDPVLLRWSQERGRILVTRNYRDFAPMVEMLGRRGEEFPGVLFISPGLPQADLRTHLKAIDAWLARHRRGESRIRGTFAWLS